MGTCQSAEQEITLQDPQDTLPRPVRCTLLQNSNSLMLELSDGTVSTITYLTGCDKVDIAYRIQEGLFMGADNRVYLLAEANSISVPKFQQALHSYTIAHSQQLDSVLCPETCYFYEQAQNVRLLVRSRQLGQAEVRYADLVSLGACLKTQAIYWQDPEFAQIVTQVCRKYSRAYDRGLNQVSNIFVGSDGSVDILATGAGQREAGIRGIEKLQRILLMALHGEDIKDYASCMQLENKSYFKHPESLAKIQNLRREIGFQSVRPYTLILNPHLKFIRDYIAVYYYKLDCYSTETVDLLISIKKADKAREMLQTHMQSQGLYNQINEANYQLLVKMLQVERMRGEGTADYNEASTRVQTAAHFLALKHKDANQYKTSYFYFTECMKHSRGKLTEQLYLQSAEIASALNMTPEANRILRQGLSVHPNSKLLHLYLILQLCDCMKIQEAEKQLMVATPDLQLLEMEISQAKIELMKTVMDHERKLQHVEKSRQILSSVTLEKYKHGHTSKMDMRVLAAYHEVLADSLLHVKQYGKAAEQYHTCSLILKNQKECRHLTANAVAAEANCYLLSGKYDEAIDLYTHALGEISPDCQALSDSVIGNRAIAKIKKGLRSEGISDIKQIVARVSKSSLQGDYNYIFLTNFLANAEGPQV